MTSNNTIFLNNNNKKNFFLLPDKYNWVTILVNLAVFYFLQYLFFKIILSEQFTNILIDKTNIAINLMKANPLIKRVVLKMINKDYNETKIQAELKNEERAKYNKKVTLKFVFIPLIIIGCLIILTLTIFSSARNWNRYDTLDILFILITYMFEIYFLFLIIKKYIHIGDETLIYKVISLII